MPFQHTPFFCEENIYHLAGHPDLSSRERFVVVISNPERAAAVWHQRAAEAQSLPVFWDYHVILIAHALHATTWDVWDLDTTLPLPCPAQRYLGLTFPTLRNDFQHLAPRFRVLDAEHYRAHFSSDRSHMRDDNGQWLQPPPDWPAITCDDHPSFMRWTHMTTTDDSIDLPTLRARFGGSSLR